MNISQEEPPSDPEMSTKSYKVLLLGNSYVGKTCILLRFSEDTYKDDYEVTIGLNYRIKTLNIDNNPIRMQIWDTSGEEKFKAIAKNFYRGAHGVLLIYDICEKNSFLDVKSWIEQIIENTDNDNLVMILCGNKCDMEKERNISKNEGENLANSYKIPFFECSAKENINIDEIFNTLAKNIYEKVGNRYTISVKLNSNNFKKKISKCCGGI
jgi:small GTP-binding protein